MAERSAIRGMTRPQLLALPVSFDLATAAKALGIGRNKAYDLVKRGEFPVRVLRLGVSYRVTRMDLFRVLGEADDQSKVAA